MMVLPLLIIVLLPKVINPSDPEMRRVRTHNITIQHECCALTDPVVSFEGDGAVHEHAELQPGAS